ncbi:MAG: hypothetical protein JW829_13500 [Pirellulales bacterium]|nr:hypothetical protein [Pirellulales bacterium]
MKPSGEKIAVSLNLAATLRDYEPEATHGMVSVALAQENTAGYLLDHLRIPWRAASFVFVDPMKRHLDDQRSNGARVDIFPQIGGG